MSSTLYGFLQILPTLIVVGLLYFTFIRPQVRKIQAHRKVLSNLAPGQTIVTESGMLGLVEELRDKNMMLVRVGPEMRIVLKRNAIAELVDHDQLFGAWPGEEQEDGPIEREDKKFETGSPGAHGDPEAATEEGEAARISPDAGTSDVDLNAEPRPQGE
ncbi:MAG: preprotein translocase subunit YajC [Pseudomonadota bacterium]